MEKYICIHIVHILYTYCIHIVIFIKQKIEYLHCFPGRLYGLALGEGGGI